jgi:hypothetical protein
MAAIQRYKLEGSAAALVPHRKHPEGEWVSALLPDGTFLVIHWETWRLAVWGSRDFSLWLHTFYPHLKSRDLVPFQWDEEPVLLDMVKARLCVVERGE